MKRIFAALVLLCVAGVTQAQDGDVPLKRAKVGDYAVYKMSGPATGSMRQEVTAVSDKEVTIKSTTTINGMELPADTRAYPIESKSDSLPKNKDVKIVSETSGKETLKIGGKEYNCTWRAVTTSVKTPEMEVKSESKVWISKDAPVFGLVKTVSTTFGSTTTLELSEVGNTKR